MSKRRRHIGPYFLSLSLLAGLILIPATTTAQIATNAATVSANATPHDTVVSAKLHPVLLRRLAEESGPAKAWVFFTDKGLCSPAETQAALRQVQATYNPRAIQRRALRGNNAARGGALFDEHDIPIVQAYIDAVTATGAQLHIKSNWLNAISVWGTRKQLERVAALPFVDRLEAVARVRHTDPLNVQEVPAAPAPQNDSLLTLNYGNSTAQLTQINLIALHDAGYTGAGVIVGILDSGFMRTHQAFNNPSHPLQVLAEWDFVNNDANAGQEPNDPSGQADHGTMILGCQGAYMPGSLIGGSFNASFVLCKTEDTSQEVPAEEDNFAAGLEFIEAHGCDMSTASLGYIDWYTQAQLNGQTAVTTIACNISTGNGVHHTNAAGNEYHDSDANVAHLIAPADAFQVITCGAVDSTGTIAYFSSDGPTADGRVKPEVLARGISTNTVSPYSDTGYTTADGTSLSTPLVACAVACLIQARPYWTVDQMRQHLFETADYYVANGTYDPLYIRGYGVINAYNAAHTCDRMGTIALNAAKYACQGSVQITVVDCDLDTNHNVLNTVTVPIASTSEPAGESVLLTETGPDSGEFVGSITLSTTNAPGVLWVHAGDTITATYNDADDGSGNPAVVTATAVVDCTPPVISNVHVTDLQARSATVAFNTNEPARGVVHYGLACGSLNQTASGSGYSTTPAVSLSGLQDNTTYFYRVDAADEAGNSASDLNCYTFTTPEVPDYFTELFSANDMDNLGLSFTPNGSVDFYLGCVGPITQLPTDPTGGTTLSLTDDSYAQVTLTGGATVALYGTTYGTFWVGSNGYITFTSGDSTYNEALAAHFNQPRVSALFDDLDPSQAGSVSWKQLSNRVVVTWWHVTHHGSANQNTFQIELYFNGQINISFLAIAQADGLAGLSRGTGTPADFMMSDLSGLGPCQATPPTAQNVTATTSQDTPVSVTLKGQDDGLPNPPGLLSYIIVTLPGHGTLADPGAGAITHVPYTLASGGKIVTYAPSLHYFGADAFTFKVNDGGTPPDGGDSNVATATVTVTGVPAVIYSWPLDTNPGWTTAGAWAFGHPTGAGSHGRDPNNGHTGTSVYGYNLTGDYTSNLPATYLTTVAINCSQVTQAQLRFWRWLGVEGNAADHATVEVSNNGTTWTTLWSNGAVAINDAAWAQVSLNIATVADHQPTVYVRWGMGPTDSAVTYPGWNIDDVELWGLVPYVPPACPGDMNCDGRVTFADIDLFVEALAGESAWTHAPCAWLNADCNGDTHVTFTDIDPFVAHIGTTCP